MTAPSVERRLPKPMVPEARRLVFVGAKRVALALRHRPFRHQPAIAHLDEHGETRADDEEVETMNGSRCPTASGRFQCDRPVGHDGECVTREPATPWVGPASRRFTHGILRQSIVMNSRKMEFPALGDPQDTTQAPGTKAGGVSE